jgi:hypothetical protein
VFWWKKGETQGIYIGSGVELLYSFALTNAKALNIEKNKIE